MARLDAHALAIQTECYCSKTLNVKSKIIEEINANKNRNIIEIE